MTCCRLLKIRAIDRSLQKSLAVQKESKQQTDSSVLICSGGLHFQTKSSTPSQHPQGYCDTHWGRTKMVREAITAAPLVSGHRLSEKPHCHVKPPDFKNSSSLYSLSVLYSSKEGMKDCCQRTSRGQPKCSGKQCGHISRTSFYCPRVTQSQKSGSHYIRLFSIKEEAHLT